MGGECMSAPPELYACLYAREFPAQSLLRLRPERRATPVAVLEGEPPLQTVCSLNAKARALGVAHGMTRAEMDAFPALTTLPRARTEEAATRAVLLDCAGTFSPRIEDLSGDTAFLCVIDIAGTGKLLGPPRQLARTLLARVKDLGITACIAVSTNFHASVCIARAFGTRTSILIVPAGEEAVALAPLPVATLDLAAAHAETFSLWGIRTLGMLAALPDHALIARIGQDAMRLRQSANGTLPHLFVPTESAFSLEEHLELDSPVDVLESLLFVIGVLLGQLIVRATAHILALASVTIALKLEAAETYTRTIRLALPSNDRQLWIKVLHLDLEAHPPSAAILALALSAEPGTIGKTQLGLFSPQLPEPTRLDITLARIRSIVGEEHVGRPVLKDNHRPDSFRMEPFRVSTLRPPVQLPITHTQSGVRRLRPPQSIAVAMGADKPASFFFQNKRYTVQQAYGPWLCAGEWWSAEDWNFEEWDLVAAAADGSILCGCLECDGTRQRWRMVALYD